MEKTESQYRLTQEIPVHLHSNSSSSTLKSWEQLCIFFLFPKLSPTPSWPIVQFGSWLHILLLPFVQRENLPVERSGHSHSRATAENAYRNITSHSAHLLLVSFPFLASSWLSETLHLSFIHLRWKQLQRTISFFSVSVPIYLISKSSVLGSAFKLTYAFSYFRKWNECFHFRDKI